MRTKLLSERFHRILAKMLTPATVQAVMMSVPPLLPLPTITIKRFAVAPIVREERVKEEPASVLVDLESSMVGASKKGKRPTFGNGGQ